MRKSCHGGVSKEYYSSLFLDNCWNFYFINKDVHDEDMKLTKAPLGVEHQKEDSLLNLSPKEGTEAILYFSKLRMERKPTVGR